MTAYLGHPGVLVSAASMSSLQPTSSRPATYRETLGGKIVAYRSPRTRRTWSASVNITTPGALASLVALLEAWDPPYVWVDEWAQATNLLTPAATAWRSGWSVVAGAGLVGGLARLDGGGVAPSSLLVDGGTVTIGDAPVVPGEPVTVSAFVRPGASGSARLDLRWVRADGTVLPVAASSQAQSPVEPLARLSATATAPANAAGVQIRLAGVSQVAAPAVTWSTGPLEWFPGQGCGSVNVEGLDLSIINAVRDPGSRLRQASVSFTVREVG